MSRTQEQQESRIVVRISRSPGCRIATPAEVAIVEGNTVEFTADAGAKTNLCLSAEAMAVLSPAPASRQIEIPAGGSVSFRFLAAQPGIYRTQAMPAGVPCGAAIPGESTSTGPVLLIAMGTEPGFSGPSVTPDR